jgi:hypothetical protein
VAYQSEFAGAGEELGDGLGEVFAELEAEFSEAQAARGEQADDAEMRGKPGGANVDTGF